MKHCGTKRLETDRLILRRYTNNDAQAMYKNWTSNEDVTKFLMWQPHKTPEISQRVIDDWISHYIEENYYN